MSSTCKSRIVQVGPEKVNNVKNVKMRSTVISAETKKGIHKYETGIHQKIAGCPHPTLSNKQWSTSIVERLCVVSRRRAEAKTSRGIFLLTHLCTMQLVEKNCAKVCIEGRRPGVSSVISSPGFRVVRSLRIAGAVLKGFAR
jgi:hypothetical protein